MTQPVRLGVLVPETNITLAADFERLSVPGVTLSWGHLAMGTGQMATDTEHAAVISAAHDSIQNAIDSVLLDDPDCVVMGFAIETFWGGRSGSDNTLARMQKMVGDRPVVSGADASLQALELLAARRIALVTPYQPAADAQVRRFFEESGVEVAGIAALRAQTAAGIAEIGPDRLRASIRELGLTDVDAILQCGTNVSFLNLVQPLESEVGCHVLTMNALLYWRALRVSGRDDRWPGLGTLLRSY